MVSDFVILKTEGVFDAREIMRLAPGSVIHPGVTILYNGHAVFSVPAAAEAPYTVDADDHP